ncbi:MAG: ABC transporter substrate-binding protein, partial [Bacteroidota bacterium]
EKLQSLPSIGYRSSISAEGIIAMNPDLIIIEKEYVKEELIEQLQATKIKAVIVEQKRSFESTKARIRIIAKELKREKEGEVMIENISKGLSKIEQKIKAVKERPKVLCVYARGQGSMQIGGSNSAFTLLDVVGAQNAVPEIEGYKPLNAEALIQANPDYILFFKMGLESVGGIDAVLQIEGVSQVTAGKKRQIIAMDGLLLTNWGPRVVEAAQELFNLTHPDYTE